MFDNSFRLVLFSLVHDFFDFMKQTGSRYDGQIAVFGNKFNEKLLNLRYFLVGAGAIGIYHLFQTIVIE
jgi:hypothetical protein